MNKPAPIDIKKLREAYSASADRHRPQCSPSLHLPSQLRSSPCHRGQRPQTKRR